MSSFLVTVGIILISLTPLVRNILFPAVGILLISLSSIIENQKTLIHKSDLIIEHLQLNHTLLDEKINQTSNNVLDKTD